jgi:hypothetical protein
MYSTSNIGAIDKWGGGHAGYMLQNILRIYVFTAIFLETRVILLHEHVALLRFRTRDECSKEQIRNNVTGFFDITIFEVSGFNGIY